MKVYNQDKTEILEKYDLNLGYLKDDIIIHHIPEVEAVQEKFHYETIKEYPNGGKDVKKVIDTPEVKYVPSHDEEEQIRIYIPYTNNELLNRKLSMLRMRRQSECFDIVNRGKLWYDKLTSEQQAELNYFYEYWLHITDNVTAYTDIDSIIPTKPSWLK